MCRRGTLKFAKRVAGTGMVSGSKIFSVDVV